MWAFFSFRELIGWTGKLRPRDQGALTLFFVFVEIYYSTAALYQSSTHITQRNLLRPPGHCLSQVQMMTLLWFEITGSLV